MEGKQANIPLIIVGFVLLAISLLVALSSANAALVSIPFLALALGLLWRGAPPRYPRAKSR